MASSETIWVKIPVEQKHKGSCHNTEQTHTKKASHTNCMDVRAAVQTLLLTNHRSVIHSLLSWALHRDAVAEAAGNKKKHKSWNSCIGHPATLLAPLLVTNWVLLRLLPQVVSSCRGADPRGCCRGVVWAEPVRRGYCRAQGSEESPQAGFTVLTLQLWLGMGSRLLMYTLIYCWQRGLFDKIPYCFWIMGNTDHWIGRLVW